MFNKLGTYVGAQGTHTLSHTHSHTQTVHYQRILIENKVYRNVTDWMILIGF